MVLYIGRQLGYISGATIIHANNESILFLNIYIINFRHGMSMDDGMLKKMVYFKLG